MEATQTEMMRATQIMQERKYNERMLKTEGRITKLELALKILNDKIKKDLTDGKRSK